MSDTHPPIPPDCPYFEKTGNIWAFVCEGHYIRVDFGYSNINADSAIWKMKPIIAAVARCAWIDQSMLHGFPASGSDFENAEAWRVWGEKRT